VAPSYAALLRPPYRALLITALGATFLGAVDALMVVTALPTAAQEIGGVDRIALAVGASMVTIVMTLPVAGSVIDRYGVARSFGIACVIFAVANVLGGIAGSMEMVAFARAILGLGAGFMFAVPLGLFALYVPDDLRPRAFGLNAAMWGVAAIIGPALGALLTGTLGWRWVFWINLPMIAAIAWSAWVAMSSHPPRQTQSDAEPRPLNIVGPVLLGLSVAPLLASDRRLAPLAVVPAVLFLFHERSTQSPVFTHRRISLAANVAAFSAGAAFLGAEVYLPVQLQVGLGEPIWVVGSALVLATIGWTTGSMSAARLGVGFGEQVFWGTTIVFAGTLAMAVPVGGPVLPILAYGVAGLGMGIASPALFTAVLADKQEGREGQATSSIPLARQAGAGLGTAIAGLVFESSLSESTVRAAERAGAHVPAVVPGARHTYVAAAALGAIGVIACRWLRDEREPVAAEPQREVAAS
jgi:MFS family permease